MFPNGEHYASVGDTPLARHHDSGVSEIKRRHPSQALSIHPTAIVSEEASISTEAEIGPYCVIAGKVEVGAHTIVESHVRLGSPYGEVIIGEHNHIQSGATLGGPPQHRDYRDGFTRLVIGDHNRIGEGASLNLGSEAGGGVTSVGNHAFIMALAHVGHDCRIADAVTLTNLAHLAGHVEVHRNAIVGGMVAVTQHVRLGEFSFVAAGALVNKDILPYTMADGRWATPRAINKVGLRRAGLAEPERRNIGRALRHLLDTSVTVNEALTAIAEECDTDAWIRHLTQFAADSPRGLARS